MKKITEYLNNSFRPDLRSLALMRIGIGAVSLADLIIRFTDIEAFFTDEGIWPAHLIYNFGWKEGYWSLHAASGSIGFQYFLFCLHFIAAVFVLLGYKTRITTIILFLLTVSLHNRNLFIQQAGDDLLRLVLFWGILLPWGAALSLDARYDPHRKITLPRFAFAGYMVMIASVYFFSALLKSDQEWHTRGDALYYALSLEQLRLPAGELLYHHPSLLRIFTFMVYYLELLLPLLLFLPLRHGHQRTLTFLLLFFLHAAIGLTLYVGLFFIIGMISALALLPPAAIDRLFGLLKLNLHDTDKNALVSDPLLLNCLSVIVAALCLISNFSSLPAFGYRLRNEFLVAMNSLRLDQYWGMFSPSVLKKDGWLVYHGADAQGRQWDLRLNQDYVDYSKPARIVAMYKSDRWRKLAENMQDDRFTFLRPLYCQWVLRDWNRRYPSKKMLTLNLYFMEKENLAGYRSTSPQKKLLSVCDDR